MTTVGYVRISDDEQGTSRSPDRQRELILDYAARNNLGPVEIVADQDVSGYSESGRPGWQRVLQLLATGEVQTLVATDLSRLHRRAREALGFAEDWLVKRGINLVLLHERVDLSSAAGRMAYAIMCAGNEFHRNVTSDKTRAAMAFKRAKGEFCGGTVPYGYACTDGRMLVVEPSEAEVVALIRSLRAGGRSLRAIAEELELLGVPTRTGKLRWQPRVLKDILDRPGAG